MKLFLTKADKKLRAEIRAKSVLTGHVAVLAPFTTLMSHNTFRFIVLILFPAMLVFGLVSFSITDVKMKRLPKTISNLELIKKNYPNISEKSIKLLDYQTTLKTENVIVKISCDSKIDTLQIDFIKNQCRIYRIINGHTVSF